MNICVLIGRLTKEVTLRTTNSGKKVATFNLAVPKNIGDGTDFIECVAWEKKAEVLSEYCGKGSKISVVGRIATRTYDDKDGKKIYVTEVVCDNIQFLDPKAKEDGQAENTPPPVVNQSSGVHGINEDDLPF
jgi:single-strand DNA-binding protein